MPKETLSPSLPSKPQVGKLYTRLLSAARKSGITTRQFQAALAYRGKGMENEIAEVIARYAGRAERPTRETYLREILGILEKTLRQWIDTDETAHSVRYSQSWQFGFDDDIQRAVISSWKPFPVVVDYRLTLKEMIVAGKYEEAQAEITPDHFPIVGEGKKNVEITIMQIEHSSETSEVLERMKIFELRPATIEELLTLGATYPDLQWRRSGIVALGSRWRAFGDDYYPWLFHPLNHRALLLSAGKQVWFAFTLFATVKEEKTLVKEGAKHGKA